MDFGKREIVVNGTKVLLDVKVDLPIADVSSDMDQVASHMSWWGSVWAAAEREAAEVDAYYRQWRANKMFAILKDDSKLAEWKVKAMLESDPEFLKFKKAAAMAEENIVLSRAVFESFSKKANQLQSKGAMQRSELAATGMTTPEHTKSASESHGSSRLSDDDGADDDVRRRDKVRNIFKGKKRGE